MMIFKTLLLWVSGLAGFVGIIGIIPLSIIGAIKLSKLSGEVDVEKRNSKKKWGIIFLVLPWVLIIGGLILLFGISILG